MRPTPPPAPDRGPRADVAPRVQTNSTHDRWDGFLAELRTRSEPLAAVFARKGRLVRAARGIAPLQLRGLRRDERALVDDAGSHRLVEEAFRAANGDALRCKLEVHDGEASAAVDPFTEELRELFQGRIEG